MGTLQDLFNYFEGLKEVVYISDVETNEIVFMNRCLRDSLGLAPTDTYIGKKCHKILQDSDEPCSFCNNGSLQVGAFAVWAHENPVMNQRFVVKDTLIVSDGKKYRVEVASRVDKSGIDEAVNYFTRREAVLNECLQLFFATPNPEQSLDQLLQHLGEKFRGDRAYIFEIYDGGVTTNTYEWCALGVKPQIDILRDLPISNVDYWVDIFSQRKAVEIHDIEQIRSEYPTTYSLLKPQGIHSLVAGPIWDGDTLRGFIGLDNPEKGAVSLLAQMLVELGGYMMPQLKRRDLYQQFNKMSYYDMLTGAYNQNALIEHNRQSDAWRSFGVVYCDINGLKETNDTEGHDAGNRLIQECYRVMESSLQTEWIYRVGGDEFVAIYRDTEEAQIQKDIDALRIRTMQSVYQMSIGYAWSDEQPIDTREIMKRADAVMYEEKDRYYKQIEESLKKTLKRERGVLGFFTDKNVSPGQIELERFLANTYCDIPFLLTALANDNGTTYFYFGDMQKNLYFISENMRRRFGFENNIVPDLINKWACRIVDAEMHKRFWDDINAVMEKKKNFHDLRYRITDVYEKDIWIRCTGKIKWTEDGTKPLFFVGSITKQDEDFVIDALTNFPTEIVLGRELERIQKSGEKCLAIGFSFNNITQINNHYGRGYGDDLIKEIANKLYEKLSGEMSFYRIAGMRCLALSKPRSEKEIREIIAQIREITDAAYHAQGIALQHTSSFACMNYPKKNVSPQDFIENSVALLKVAHETPAQLYVDDSDGNIEKMQQVSTLESELIRNILDGMENFRIVIQPVVSAEDGRIVGGETLIRWKFNGESVSPGVFIPIIENEHMIHLAGRWVFEQAAHACVRICSYIPDFYLTVNVSLQQLDDEGFFDFIRQTLQKYDLEGKHIVVELTESCIDDQPEKLQEFVEACNALDIRIALDDFGSGYSSMRVLLRYPCSIIKLDRSMLLEMSDSCEKNEFITSIVYACHQFGKKVCMEGVETDRQNTLVKEAGCDLIQGFYYYRPTEVDQVYELVAKLYGDN